MEKLANALEKGRAGINVTVAREFDQIGITLRARRERITLVRGHTTNQSRARQRVRDESGMRAAGRRSTVVPRRNRTLSTQHRPERGAGLYGHPDRTAPKRILLSRGRGRRYVSPQFVAENTQRVRTERADAKTGRTIPSEVT